MYVCDTNIKICHFMWFYQDLPRFMIWDIQYHASDPNAGPAFYLLCRKVLVNETLNI